MAETENDGKDADENKDATGEEGAEGGKPVGKSGRTKKLLMLLGLVVVVIAGAGAYFSGLIGHGPSHEEAETAKHAAGQPVFYTLPEFIVNLNSASKQTSFLKMTVVLQVTGELDSKAVEANLPRVLDSFNTYLREMRSSDLTGSASIYRLREELLARVNKTMAPTKVDDLLFKEIIIQ